MRKMRGSGHETREPTDKRRIENHSVVVIVKAFCSCGATLQELPASKSADLLATFQRAFPGVQASILLVNLSLCSSYLRVTATHLQSGTILKCLPSLVLHRGDESHRAVAGRKTPSLG